MAIDFPNSPTTGDTFTVGNRTWEFDGTAWELQTTAIDPIQDTLLDAKGDLIVATAADTAGRLAVGTNDYVLTADSGETTGIKWAAPNYGLREIVRFTSSGTFTKATYPWLRAVNVKVQGGGGGAAGAATTSASQVSMGSGGGGGSYAESFIIASSLSATETVTIGAGGAGGSGAAGTSGGASSFGSLVSASGGFNGLLRSASTPPTLIVANGNPATVTGDLTNGGTAGTYGVGLNNTFVNGGTGGPSVLGAGGRGSTFAEDGEAGRGYGGGGGGGANAQNQATARTGGSGSAGIVIVELYA